MQVTKIDLSEEELKCLFEQRFFIVKQSATEKVKSLFAGIESALSATVKENYASLPLLDLKAGKIFRGENYRGFPYILLDYPRAFNTESVFAFRTMIWWGNEFSCTLHLQGKALEENRNALKKNLFCLLNTSTYFCVNQTPWQYDFSRENYRLLDGIKDVVNRVEEASFIKLSRRLSLADIDKLPAFTERTMILFLDALKNR